jgi:hypothetical protein
MPRCAWPYFVGRDALKRGARVNRVRTWRGTVGIVQFDRAQSQPDRRTRRDCSTDLHVPEPWLDASHRQYALHMDIWQRRRRCNRRACIAACRIPGQGVLSTGYIGANYVLSITEIKLVGRIGLVPRFTSSIKLDATDNDTPNECTITFPPWPIPGLLYHPFGSIADGEAFPRRHGPDQTRCRTSGSLPSPLPADAVSASCRPGAGSRESRISSFSESSRIYALSSHRFDKRAQEYNIPQAVPARMSSTTINSQLQRLCGCRFEPSYDVEVG